MNMLLGFVPFAVFAVLEHFTGLVLALALAAFASLVIIARDLLRRQSPKLLEIGSALIFGGLSLYAWWARPAWSLFEVRLYVDACLLLIVLASVAMGRPFTQAYARERTAPEVWEQPSFRRGTRAIALAWAAAFAVLVLADTCMVFVPQLPLKVDILVSLAALYAAARYTMKRTAQSAASQARTPQGE